MMDNSPISPPGAETFTAGVRVTQEELQSAEKQVERNYSALMDAMEASVTTQGEWFLSAGSKDNGAGVDTRALLLLDVDERPSEQTESGGVINPAFIYTFVTRKGIMTKSFAINDDRSVPFLTAAINAKGEFLQTEDTGFHGNNRVQLNYLGKGQEKTRIVLDFLRPFAGDEAAFGEKVKRSIEKAGERESVSAQERAKLAEIQKQAEVPVKLSTMISSLPPRQ